MTSGDDIRVPPDIAAALRAEAQRRARRPGEILVDFLRAYWPQFVAHRVAEDLRPPVDVDGVEITPPLALTSPVEQNEG